MIAWLLSAVAAPLPDACGELPSVQAGRPWGAITHIDGLASDLSAIDASLDGANALVAEALHVDPLETTLEVVLHPPGDVLGAPAPAVRLDDGVALIVGDRELATLHMVHPSCQRGKTALGERYDDAWLRETVVGQLTTLYLRELSSGSGWSFVEQPPWFVRGYPTWIAREHTREAPWPIMEKKARRGRVQAASGRILVDRPHVEGALIVRGLAHRLGEDALKSLLLDDAEDVYASLRDHDITPNDLRELVP